MPDYHIIVHMKVGPPKRGISWFASHDLEPVKFLVSQKVRETIGQFPVDHIHIQLALQAKDKILHAGNLASFRKADGHM